MDSSIKSVILLIILLQNNNLLVMSQQNHINSFIYSNGLVAGGENTERNHGGGGCRRPSLEITTNSISKSTSPIHKVAICKSLKPIKPNRILEMSKSLCAPNWTICNHLEKGIVGLAWNKLPKGCFGFKFGNEAKKPTGYGTKCYRNLYFDGILCCPIDNKNHHTKKNNIYKKNTKHYLLTNEIH